MLGICNRVQVVVSDDSRWMVEGLEMESPRKARLKKLGRDEKTHPSVFERISNLLPRHSSAPTSHPAPEPVVEKKEAPYDHALKVQIISWNMNDTLPKGDLAALLGVVPPYNTDNRPAASDFQLEDTGHPYHIIVVAGQECPTGLLPMGMGAVKMERSKDSKSKSKNKEEEGSPSKPKRPRKSEEDEYQPLADTPTVLNPPSTPSTQTNIPLPGQAQHSSGWSALLEDWYSKGLGAKRHFTLEDWQTPVSPGGLPPPSPAPSRSPSLPALGLPPPISDPTKLIVPPSPRRINTFVHQNGHAVEAGAGPYVLVAKERLMGIYLAVFVHKETRSLVRGFSKSSVTAGLIGGRLGNKGGVGISLNIAGSSFLFVNAHLAAHEGRQAMRLENMEKIQAELKVDNFGEPVHPRKPIPDSTKPDITDDFDYTFIFGDLNFRLNVSRLHADWLISRQEYLRAQEFDELRANMRSNKIFPGFEEPVISFPPTFKYDVPKSRHHSHRDKDGREREKTRKVVERKLGVRVSIRRSRKRRKSKGKIEDRDDQKDESFEVVDPKEDPTMQLLQPVNERETEVSSAGEEDESDEQDQDQEVDSVSAFSGVARPSGSTNRPPSTRSHRSAVLSSRSPLSEPDTDANDSPLEDEDTSLQHNTQLNSGAVTPGRSAVLKIFTRSAKQSWRSIVAKSTSSLGAVPLPKSPTSPKFDIRPRAKSPTKMGRTSPGPTIGLGPSPGLRAMKGMSMGPELGVPAMGMGRSQPNLVIDTGVEGESDPLLARTRASVDGSRSTPNVDHGARCVSGGEKSVQSGLGVTGVGGTLAPPAIIRATSSLGSVADGTGTLAGDDSSSESGNVKKGVYDTSSKQRVPSWCDRIVYKSTVLPPEPPPSIPPPSFTASLSDTLHEDSAFARVSNLITGMRRRGSRGRKDSVPRSGSVPQPRAKEHSGSLSRGASLRIKETGTGSSHTRTRDALLSESRPSPFLKQPGDDEDDSGIVITNGGQSSRPGSSGKAGKRPCRPGSSGSTGTTPTDQPASLHWPRTNPFARLLHPNLHTPGGPGLIHAVSMEPVPQPSVDPTPRPRSLSTSEGREKTRERTNSGTRQSGGDGDAPVEGSGIFRFFKFNREPTIVAEPEPEPEPVEVPLERRRGDIACLSYGTLDDKEMQRLGGKSDHRPVIGTYAVYI